MLKKQIIHFLIYYTQAMEQRQLECYIFIDNFIVAGPASRIVHDLPPLLREISCRLKAGRIRLINIPLLINIPVEYLPSRGRVFPLFQISDVPPQSLPCHTVYIGIPANCNIMGCGLYIPCFLISPL